MVKLYYNILIGVHATKFENKVGPESGAEIGLMGQPEKKHLVILSL
jgi:hypothetical protein